MTNYNRHPNEDELTYAHRLADEIYADVVAADGTRPDLQRRLVQAEEYLAQVIYEYREAGEI